MNQLQGHMHTRTQKSREQKSEQAPHHMHTHTCSTPSDHMLVIHVPSHHHTFVRHNHDRVHSCTLTVAGVALAVGAAAAALAGLTGGHLKLPSLARSSRSEDEHGGDLGGCTALLCQVRVHLAATIIEWQIKSNQSLITTRSSFLIR